MCSNQYRQQKDGSECLKLDFVQKHKKKYAAIFPDMEELPFLQAASDNEIQCDFMQLSPDCKSPSFLSPDDSKDHCLKFCIQECFPSMSSLSGRRCCVTFDGSMISPTDDASFVLGGGFSEEEDVIWINNSIGDELEEHSGECSESRDSSRTWSCCDDSSMLEGSSTPLSKQEGTPYAGDFDTTGIWVSSLDLDMEDSDLVHGKDQGLGIFDSSFPSPRKTIQFRPFSSAPPSSFLRTKVDKNLSENCESQEPLFWPFADESYCLPEFDDFLCLSPRKDVRNIAVQKLHTSESVNPRQENIHNAPNLRKYNREGCRRRIVFSPPSNKASGDRKTRESNRKNNHNISTTPSKLSKLSQASSERYQRNNAKTQEHKSDEDFHSKPLLVHEAGIFQNFVAEVPIFIWRQNSSSNEQKDYAGVCSESDDSSCTWSSCDDSSVSEGSSTTVSSQDYDTASIWVSSMDIHTEDPELVQCKEQGLWSDAGDRPFSCTQNESKNCDSHEPLFWPFDLKSYRLPEFENLFCLSPCKDVRRRRSNQSVSNAAASTLSRASSEQYLCNISMKEKPFQRNAKTHNHTSDDFCCRPSRNLESGMLQSFVAGVPIETLVGLNEFDGHEGINVGFNESELTFEP